MCVFLIEHKLLKWLDNRATESVNTDVSMKLILFPLDVGKHEWPSDGTEGVVFCHQRVTSDKVLMVT